MSSDDLAEAAHFYYGGHTARETIEELSRLRAVEQAARELREMIVDKYLAILEARIPQDALGPLYAALFVAPPQPLTEQEITRGQEIAAMLDGEKR